LKDKVVVVTGASKGIGLAASRAFVERGANVAMLARSSDRLGAEARSIGEGALAIAADVSDPESVRKAFARIASQWGRVDVLLNNAGVAVLTSIEDATDAEIEQSMATNLLGPVYTTRAAIPLLRAAGGGSVINISSESTMSPFPFLSLYAASKGGLETFTKAAHTELKPLGIRVTVVVCGATMTEFASAWEPQTMERFFAAAQESGHLAHVSAGQPMSPADVADALVYVASRPSGQIIDVLHIRSHPEPDEPSVFDSSAPS
jgi:NAD(P)-dependent dehydrogenase (short-subunit alcohol dehydrogenase family)